MSRRTIVIGALAALALIGALVLSFTVLRPANADDWEFIGPNQSEITSLVFDPITPTTLYAGTLDGVYKSEDGGTTWRRILSGPTAATSLLIDPLTPTTLYAAYGYRNIFKSEDGGETWRIVNNGLDKDAWVNCLSIDPVNPRVIYAGTNKGVYKSENRGGAWRLVEQMDSVLALAIDPASPTTLYAGGEWWEVRKSGDGGETWRRIDIDSGNRFDVNALLIDPENPAVVFAGTDAGVYKSEDGGETWRGDERMRTGVYRLLRDPAGTVYANVEDGVYRSADGGATWHRVEFSLPASAFSKEERIRLLAVDPVTPATLYAKISPAASGLFRSNDGGATWRPAGLHSIIYSLALTPSALYAGTFRGGVYRSDDRGVTWRTINEGLTHFYVSALAVDPTTPTTLYAATGDGVNKSVDGGETWRAVGLRGRWVYTLAFDPQRPTTLYAGADAGVFVSEDGGETWRAAGLSERRVLALAFDPTAPATLYAGAEGGVYRSDDNGASWRAVNDGLGEHPVFTLAIAPTTPSTLYAGTKEGVFRSNDGGATWSTVVGPRLGLGSSVVILIDPTTPTTVYVGNAGAKEVLKSDDNGETWSEYGSLHPFALVIDPSQPKTIYAGTLTGVYRRVIDGGQGWLPFR